MAGSKGNIGDEVGSSSKLLRHPPFPPLPPAEHDYLSPTVGMTPRKMKDPRFVDDFKKWLLSSDESDTLNTFEVDTLDEVKESAIRHSLMGALMCNAAVERFPVIEGDMCTINDIYKERSRIAARENRKLKRKLEQKIAECEEAKAEFATQHKFVSEFVESRSRPVEVVLQSERDRVRGEGERRTGGC